MKKITLYIDIMWGVIIMFIFVGVLSSKQEKAIMMMIIATVNWAAMYIIRRAILAYIELKNLK